MNGKSHFTDKEVKALGELGRNSLLVELSEQHKLEDELTQLFLNKYISVAKYNALTSGQKKVTQMIGGVR